MAHVLLKDKNGSLVESNMIFFYRNRDIHTHESWDGNQHPAAIFSQWHINDLNEVGIYELRTEDNFDSNYYRLTGYDYIFTDANRAIKRTANTIVKGADTIYQYKHGLVHPIRDAKISGGVVWNDGSVDHTIDTDQSSILNLTALIAATAAGLTVDPQLTWRSRENVNIPLNPSSLASLATTTLGHVEGCFKANVIHKDALAQLLQDVNDSVKPIQDLIDYDVTTGWPV